MAKKAKRTKFPAKILVTSSGIADVLDVTDLRSLDRYSEDGDTVAYYERTGYGKVRRPKATIVDKK